jgi:hemolysin activation/secretion protein
MKRQAWMPPDVLVDVERDSGEMIGRDAMRRLPAPKLLALALLGALAALRANAIEPPTPPDAGSILQQIKPTAPPAPSSAQTGLSIEQPAGGTVPVTEAFTVNKLEVRGNTKISTAALHALIADAEGKQLTLRELAQVADRITEYYHQQHFPLARAIIPAQVIKDGVVLIQVLEARYGKVNLSNRSHVSDSLLAATLAPLKSGDVIEQDELDHALLLLSDIPTLGLNAVLKPGEAVGTSDLDVTTLPGPRLLGSASIDDYGNRYTGRTRGGATLSLIDPFAHGDDLSLAGLSSGGDFNYARLSYENTLNGLGTRLGAAFSGLHYDLGDGLEALDGYGTAAVASLWGKQPLLRSESINLYLQVQYDRLKLHDALDSSQTQTDRHLDTFTTSLSGDARDALLAGGTSTWNLSVTAGHLTFDNTAAEVADAATAKTIGAFSKWNLNVAHLQKLSPSNGLYLSFAWQGTDENLDSSEKMIGGGPYTVRAYDMGVLSGDAGELGTAEFQHDLGNLAGAWLAAAFLDVEHLTVNKSPWAAGENSATLRGAGVSLSWVGAHGWAAKASVAARFGGVPALVPDSSTVRAWAELSKGF